MATTPYTPTPETTDAQRHTAGLRTVAALLAEPGAYDRIVRLEQDGVIDPALAAHAAALAAVRRSTTVQLEMSDADASTLLSILITALDQAWGMVGMDALPSEDALGAIGDHAAAIVAVAHALCTPAFILHQRAQKGADHATS